MFRTLLNRLESYDGKSIVISLGRVEPLPEVPRGKKLTFPTVNESVAKVISELDPVLLRNGVYVIIGESTYLQFKATIDAVLRRLAVIYAKFVLFPQRSDTIPDPLAQRIDTGFLLLREIAAKSNFPLHLRFPLCDKLERMHLGLPVTLLLPGPSLAYTLPYLNRIKSSSIVVCMARSLDFLRSSGHIPDFVVQLDTAPRMVHLIPQNQLWPETILVTLSVANVAPIADKFRGVLFMDSFDRRFLDNPYRLRESWLSGFIACLGLAECLHAPDVYVAGTDHCWYDAGAGSNHYTSYEESPLANSNAPLWPMEKPPLPVCSASVLTGGTHAPDYDSFDLPDVIGRTAKTSFHYFAIAAEAGFVAREISMAMGCGYHTLFDQGILDSEVFQIDGMAHLFNTYSPLNRFAVDQALDSVLSQREYIDLAGYLAMLNQTIPSAKAEACRLELALLANNLPEALSSPAVDSLKRAVKYRKFPVITDDHQLITITVSLLREWAVCMGQAANHARLQQQLDQGKSITLLCLPDERAEVKSRLAATYKRFYPYLQINSWAVVIPPIKCLPKEDLAVDSFGTLTLFDYTQEVVLASKGFANEFKYLLEQLPRDTWIIV